MKTLNHLHTQLHTVPRLLCIAIAAAFALPAGAEELDESVARLIKPESSVTLGIGNVNADNQRFGTHNGMADKGMHVIGEASVNRRNNETGTWLRFNATNLGLPTRELRIDHEKQGTWGYYLEYNQMPRRAPYDIHTNLSGIGGNALSYPNYANPNPTGTPPVPLQPRTTAAETPIRTDRFKTTLGYMRVINPRLEFAFKFQNEDKRGERMFGRGTTSPAQEFLAEPINSTTRQFDMTLSYLGEQLQLTGGYYGSFYNNHRGELSVAGGAAGLRTPTATAITPLALPPDNHAHQLYLSGGYDFNRTTRANFRLAHSKAIQNDGFILPVVRANPAAANTGSNDSGRSDLGGQLDTTLFVAGLSTRPVKNLTVLANMRYENRDDKTTVAQYIFVPATPGGSTTGFNERRSLKIVSGKLEASYQMAAYRFSGGVDMEQRKRNMEGIRVVGYRPDTKELTYRAEVKRSLTDSISGALSYSVSNRTGSDYIELRNTANALYNGNGGLLQPIYIADRDRQKIKLLTDWSPTDTLSVQLAAEDSRDSYADRNKQGASTVGARKGDSQLLSLDVSYALSESWKVSGYTSRFATAIDQGANQSATAASYWTAGIKNIGTNFGFGVKGKVGSTVTVGANLNWAEDQNKYTFNGVTSTLPDITSKQTTLNLFGTYAYSKDTTLRLDYVHDRRKTNDWTWNAYTYNDGTWIYQQPVDNVQFIGISLRYNFR